MRLKNAWNDSFPPSSRKSSPMLTRRSPRLFLGCPLLSSHRRLRSLPVMLLKLKALAEMRKVLKEPFSPLFFSIPFSFSLYLIYHHSHGRRFVLLSCLVRGSLALAWVVSEMHTCKYNLITLQEWDVNSKILQTSELRERRLANSLLQSSSPSADD